MAIKVMFFSSGNTAAFQNGQQIPMLQESWLMLYVHMAVACGVDPADLDITMPDGHKAKIIEVDGVLNWAVT